MGTRSNIFITGRGRYGEEHGTVRLYRHDDGNPGAMLRTFVQAHLLAEPLVARQKDFDSKVHLTDMPAWSFAHLLIAASCGWYGPAIRLDNNRDVDDWPPWSFERPFDMEMLSPQTDLEWVYLVELPALRLTIYGGYGDAAQLIDRGPCDPREGILRPLSGMSLIVDTRIVYTRLPSPQ